MSLPISAPYIDSLTARHVVFQDVTSGIMAPQASGLIQACSFFGRGAQGTGLWIGSGMSVAALSPRFSLAGP